MEEELDRIKPTHVIVAAGLTGRPNVDWCETHKQDTIRVNVIGTLNIADTCTKRGIHCMIYATGCIFEYDEAHKIGGVPFTEEDEPNFKASFYSLSKGMLDTLLKSYPHVLTLRIRMPISDDLSGRSFVTKIAQYHKVVDIPNSMSVLADLLPLSLAMSAAKMTGTYNFCNPKPISHNQVLASYKKHVDPHFEWNNFSVEEQAKLLAAGRSNNTLDTQKLEKAAKELGMPLPDVFTALDKAMACARHNLESSGQYPAGLPKKLGPGNKPVQ
uniref:NAD-dependent epimerase/dehydratase domain-containing protein n=1 Tax=Hemiselmis andersenii TaxID=464988 RepID=A0A7S0TSC3_HEMAN